MKTEAPWPEGVIARYLTLGTGTVDLTTRTTPTAATITTCTGCPAAQEHLHHRTRGNTSGEWLVHDPQTAITDAHTWAQAHAEFCRAMPRPV